MNRPFLINVFIVLAAACIIVPLASRFKLGSILGYLIIGVLIGPFGFKLIGNADEIMHFAEFGVIMMLFLIGMELDPETLWRLRKAIAGLGSLQVILTTAVLSLCGLALGFDWRTSLAVSMALCLSSTALVLQMLQEKNLMHTTTGETSFAILLFQDIAVIIILIIMPLLVAQGNAPIEHFGLISSFSGLARAGIITAVIGGVIILGNYFSHYFFYLIAKTNLREVFTATSLALIVGITLLMQAIGMSPSLGAFVAGVVLANSEYKRSLETDIEPFKGLLLGLFFISVGMRMDFSILVRFFIPLLSLVSALILIKASILFFLGRVFGLTKAQAIGIALGLSQGSEFAFVLFQYANTLGVITADIANFLILGVALSMAATPIIMLAYRRLVLPLFLSPIKRQYDQVDEQNAVILAGYGRFGQIIGRFLTAQGIKITILEKDPEQIELLRKLGFKVYFGDASRLDLLKNAGAETATLLIVAIDDPDTSLEIARLTKQEFPKLKIYSRARNRRHAYELNKAGVIYFKRETFDSALKMAQDLMEFLGYNSDTMRRKARAFAQHDEASLHKSFEFFNEKKELLSFTKHAMGELEHILQDDKLSGKQRKRVIKASGK
ncbi:MAG: cation:proton antiporter [Tatlockia sp.]|nr:cation:proton antiporter [Tatlockia sp.]